MFQCVSAHALCTCLVPRSSRTGAAAMHDQTLRCGERSVALLYVWVRLPNPVVFEGATALYCYSCCFSQWVRLPIYLSNLFCHGSNKGATALFQLLFTEVSEGATAQNLSVYFFAGYWFGGIFGCDPDGATARTAECLYNSYKHKRTPLPFGVFGCFACFCSRFCCWRCLCLLLSLPRSPVAVHQRVLSLQ